MSGRAAVPSRRDVIAAATLTAVSVAELFVGYAFEDAASSGPGPEHLLVAAAMGSVLVWRRVRPLLVAPAVFALAVVQSVVLVQPNVYGEIIMAIVALYGVTAYGRTEPRADALRLAASAAAALGLGFVLGLQDPDDPVGQAVTLILFGGLVLGAGRMVHGHRLRADAMALQRDQADGRARRVAGEERARIARELHDVVAHGMSVVVLQARGGRHMLETDRDRARAAFDDIEKVAKDCLGEMRRLLGILRTDDDPAPRLPQPDLSQLEALVAQAKSSGASVDLTVTGCRRELAPAIELSLYRIGQEALTNALRHAAGSATRIGVRFADDFVSIEVEDDGHGAAPGPPGESGHGLIGMRERTELYGGDFRAGPTSQGGFRVAVRLPLPSVSA